MDIWLVCYDIECDKERRQVATVLLQYGERIQHSVFKLTLSAMQRQALMAELTQVVSDEKSVLFFSLPARELAKSHSLCGTAIPPSEGFVIVV